MKSYIKHIKEAMILPYASTSVWWGHDQSHIVVLDAVVTYPGRCKSWYVPLPKGWDGNDSWYLVSKTKSLEFLDTLERDGYVEFCQVGRTTRVLPTRKGVLKVKAWREFVLNKYEGFDEIELTEVIDDENEIKRLMGVEE